MYNNKHVTVIWIPSQSSKTSVCSHSWVPHSNRNISSPNMTSELVAADSTLLMFHIRALLRFDSCRLWCALQWKGLILSLATWLRLDWWLEVRGRQQAPKLLYKDKDAASIYSLFNLYTLTGHFIRYTLFLLGCAPFVKHCWKHSSEISDVTTSSDIIISCCRCVRCILKVT